ncbi:uncharacterized protein LOC143876345 [Tasmannia lanceolata]|uniref:uncharacterized protein LOC143876345 n=1 Tax=Tasmannia lanceolata TaxID=3420 RepID=UPI004063C1FB
MAVGMLCYDANLPFNVANSPYWQPMFNAINAEGSGYKAPSFHDLRGRILKKTLEDVNNYLREVKNSWKTSGCSIMADGWTDTKQRALINFLVYCPKGVVFPKSVNASSVVKNADALFAIFEVGPKNVVQFITDSEPSYKAPGKKLEIKYATFFWTPCAAHCLDLILEHFGKPDVFPLIGSTIDRARKITRFINNHTALLNLMRQKFTGGRDLCRPLWTRFATNFISIQSLVLHRKALQQMFVSDEYAASRYICRHPIVTDPLAHVFE